MLIRLKNKSKPTSVLMDEMFFYKEWCNHSNPNIDFFSDCFLSEFKYMPFNILEKFGKFRICFYCNFFDKIRKAIL